MTPQEFKNFFGYIDYWQTFYYPSHLFANYQYCKINFYDSLSSPAFLSRSAIKRRGKTIFAPKNYYYNSKFYLFLKVTPDKQ